MHIPFIILKWIKRQFRNIRRLLLQNHFDRFLRLYEDEIKTLMVMPNESLNHFISQILNKIRFDFLRILERIENPYFSLISKGGILGSI